MMPTGGAGPQAPKGGVGGPKSLTTKPGFGGAYDVEPAMGIVRAFGAMSKTEQKELRSEMRDFASEAHDEGMSRDEFQSRAATMADEAVRESQRREP